MESRRPARDAEWARRAHGPRTLGERDAVTVEIGYALVTASLLAGTVFLAVAGPALFGTASATWIQNAQWIGGAVFIGRVVWVLLRWPGPRRHPRQPSHPGRTRPDS